MVERKWVLIIIRDFDKTVITCYSMTLTKPCKPIADPQGWSVSVGQRLRAPRQWGAYRRAAGRNSGRGRSAEVDPRPLCGDEGVSKDAAFIVEDESASKSTSRSETLDNGEDEGSLARLPVRLALCVRLR